MRLASCFIPAGWLDGWMDGWVGGWMAGWPTEVLRRISTNMIKEASSHRKGRRLYTHLEKSLASIIFLRAGIFSTTVCLISISV